MGKQPRDSNFELLRIVAMLLIIGCHFVTYANFPKIEPGLTDERLALNVLRLGGKTGVIIFMMITGYFMISKQTSISEQVKGPANWNKIKSLSLQTLWYSIVMMFLSVYVAGYQLTEFTFLRTLFPIILEQYWFPTAFIIVLFITPALNLIMTTFTQRQITPVLFGLIIVMGLPLIMPRFTNDVTGVILGYLLGAYIRRFDITISKKWNVLAMVGTIGATTMLTAFLMWASTFDVLAKQQQLFFVTGFNINAFILATLLFLFMKQTHIGTIKSINVIAGTTFGVFLFHEHRVFGKYIWHNIVTPNQWHGLQLIIVFVTSVIGVFVVGMLMDFIRQGMNKLIGKLVSFFYSKSKA